MFSSQLLDNLLKTLDFTLKPHGLSLSFGENIICILEICLEVVKHSLHLDFVGVHPRLKRAEGRLQTLRALSQIFYIF